MDHWRELLAYVPFIGAAVSEHTPGRTAPALVARLLEIAVLLGVMYGTYAKDMEQIKTGMSELKEQLAEIRRDFYRPRFEDARP
jgi:hypothetical protein